MEIFIHFVAHTSMESASCVTFPEGDSEVPAAGVFDHENPPSERYRKGLLCHICRFGGRDDPRVLIQKWPRGYVLCITPDVMPLGEKGGFAVSTVRFLVSSSPKRGKSQEGQVPRVRHPSGAVPEQKKAPSRWQKPGLDAIGSPSKKRHQKEHGNQPWQRRYPQSDAMHPSGYAPK